MLRSQLVVLVVVATATLPIDCLSSRLITWPMPEKNGAVRNRKGLRHSPGILMDVMRTPTSVKSISFPHSVDQIASFTGGRPYRFYSASPKIPQLPINNFIVPGIVNKRRKPYRTFKDHIQPWHMPSPTLNFAPANAIPWHTSTHILNVAPVPKPRPPALWHLIPYPTEPEPTSTTTPSPSETQESNIVNQYIPSCTEAPASFTKPGIPRRGRKHVRIFSNAHQYPDITSTEATPSNSPFLRTAPVLENTVIVETDSVDDDHRESPWFTELLREVITTAEMAQT